MQTHSSCPCGWAALKLPVFKCVYSCVLPIEPTKPNMSLKYKHKEKKQKQWRIFVDCACWRGQVYFTCCPFQSHLEQYEAVISGAKMWITTSLLQNSDRVGAKDLGNKFFDNVQSKKAVGCDFEHIKLATTLNLLSWSRHRLCCSKVLQ